MNFHRFFLPSFFLFSSLVSTPFSLTHIPPRTTAKIGCTLAMLALIVKEEFLVRAAHKELATALALNNTVEQDRFRQMSSEALEKAAIDTLFRPALLPNEIIPKALRPRPHSLADAKDEVGVLLAKRNTEPAGSPLYQELTFKIAVAAAMYRLAEAYAARQNKGLLLVGYLGALTMSGVSPRLFADPLFRFLFYSSPLFPILKGLAEGNLSNKGAAFWHTELGYLLGLLTSEAKFACITGG